MKYQRFFFRLIIFISILIWCAAFSFKIITSGSDISIAAAPFFNFFFDNVCHQDEGKLIALDNFNFLVCARCSGIYFGALLASLFSFITLVKKEIPFSIFAIASFLLVADVFLNNHIFSSYNKVSAFLTGFYFGSICLLITVNILEEYFITKVKN